MKKEASFLAGTALGAGLMYITDPILGRRRRARVRDAAIHSTNVLRRFINVGSRDTANRMKGVLEETKSLFRKQEPDDAVLTDRVRTRVGRVSSHPNVEVIVVYGYVTLMGPVVDREEKPVLKAAQSVKGVRGVVNRMEPYRPVPTMPTQESHAQLPDILQSHWAPATRIAVGAMGTLMAAAEAKVGPVKGALTRVAGIAFLLRAATNMEFTRLFGLQSDPRAVDIQKTIKIAAPVERVYSFWTNYENFPLFMSRIQEVRDLGNGRSHWVVVGPLGARLEWDAKVTQMVANKLLAWASEPGSPIQHAGMVRFDPEKDLTRVQIRLSYNPPAGAIGHFIASLFGSSPKQEMDEDLGRLKTSIEMGKRPHTMLFAEGKALRNRRREIICFS